MIHPLVLIGLSALISGFTLHCDDTSRPLARMSGKGTYSQGSNWTSSGGSFYNGNGQTINNPPAYFSSVASNSNGYNSGYSNGNGQTISNPSAYYSAVASDKYGYNSK